MKTQVIQDEQAAPAPQRTGSTVAIVFGAIGVAIALVLLVGAGFGLWALGQRDADGFYTAGPERLATPTSALATNDLDVDAGAPSWVFDDAFATVRLGATSAKPVFVGIGPTAAVTRYLAGARHAQITDVDVDPFRVTSHVTGGPGRLAPPGAQSFWRARASGAGTRTLTWDVESGNWSAVVMNADGSPGVVAQTSVGAEVPSLKWVAIGTLIAGVLFGIGGGLLLWVGTRRPRTAA
ncbi:MAG TPA: hypothetical protein VH276_05945 [Solirubrobacteraceae bacterium]|jgi:hypothetical protein|nr:hypothetical protein [Solirubrobacteraceae bacterium]